jgi:hypothetical protein
MKRLNLHHTDQKSNCLNRKTRRQGFRCLAPPQRLRCAIRYSSHAAVCYCCFTRSRVGYAVRCYGAQPTPRYAAGIICICYTAVPAPVTECCAGAMLSLRRLCYALKAFAAIRHADEAALQITILTVTCHMRLEYAMSRPHELRQQRWWSIPRRTDTARCRLYTTRRRSVAMPRSAVVWCWLWRTRMDLKRLHCNPC